MFSKRSHMDLKGQTQQKNSSFHGGYVVFLRLKKLPEGFLSFFQNQKMRFFRGNEKKFLGIKRVKKLINLVVFLSILQ